MLPPPLLKVIATKGLKQVQKTVSYERSVNTTLLAFISAGGTHIHPVFFFLSWNFFLMSIKQATPAGWIGFAHPSGWINADTFLESPKHFVTCTDCHKHEPQLLIIQSDIIIQAI